MPTRVPRIRRPLLASLGKLGLRLLGWRVAGAFPDRSKFVVIVAPHTSNWDFIIGFLAYLATSIDTAWFGKHSIFRWPFGNILRSFGGIPVERSTSHNVVEQSIAEFTRREKFILALAPEGTRRRVGTWRSGFYYIALGAVVPVVPVSLDFGRRDVLVGPEQHLTGDYATDLQRLAERFATVRPRNPELYEALPRP